MSAVLSEAVFPHESVKTPATLYAGVGQSISQSVGLRNKLQKEFHVTPESCGTAVRRCGKRLVETLSGLRKKVGDNGREHGNYWVKWVNGKENRNYCSIIGASGFQKELWKSLTSASVAGKIMFSTITF